MKNIEDYDIDAITEYMVKELLSPAPDTLTRQEEILDTLFTSILEKKVLSGENDTRTSMEWIALALRAQKQCADTVKTKAAVDYMANLNGMSPYSFSAQASRARLEDFRKHDSFDKE